MKVEKQIDESFADLIHKGKSVVHQICDPHFTDDSLHTKWWGILNSLPKEKDDWDKGTTYLNDDYTGKGKIKPGETVQWQHFDILEVDDKGKWSIKITYTSKVYTVRENVIEDIYKDRIPSRVLREVFIKTPAALDIFELFVESNKGLTITKISTITGLSRNTAYRFCRYLVKHDWLKREDDLSYTVLDPEYFDQPVKFFKD